MPLSITRRHAALALPLLFGAGTMPALAEEAAAVADIEQRHGGRLGVFAVDTGSGRTLAHRADERFLMCSTFKGLLAALVLARVDAGQESLGRMVPYSEKDVIFTSPITKANLTKGAMSVEALGEAMAVVSDNTAENLLMRSTGGPPPGLTNFIRSLGDTVTRSDRYEPDSNQYSGVLDTTTPRAMTTSAQKILLGDVLRPQSRQKLEDWMVASTPGLKRIRAALPPAWIAGDRPGTSVQEETNDYAIVRPPGRAPLLVAAYYDAPRLSMDDREIVLREAGSAFVKWAAEQSDP
jgi:beta-lactamase class A